MVYRHTVPDPDGLDRSSLAPAPLATPTDLPPTEMVLRLLADNRHIAQIQRRAIAVCDEQGDGPTGNILQDLLDQTERRIWFLFEVSRLEAADS